MFIIIIYFQTTRRKLLSNPEAQSNSTFDDMIFKLNISNTLNGK